MSDTSLTLTPRDEGDEKDDPMSALDASPILTHGNSESKQQSAEQKYDGNAREKKGVFPLLDLPFELRAMIFEMALSTPSYTIDYEYGFLLDRIASESPYVWKVKHGQWATAFQNAYVGPTLLCTTKQIKEEAIGLLYTATLEFLELSTFAKWFAHIGDSRRYIDSTTCVFVQEIDIIDILNYKENYTLFTHLVRSFSDGDVALSCHWPWGDLERYESNSLEYYFSYDDFRREGLKLMQDFCEEPKQAGTDLQEILVKAISFLKYHLFLFPDVGPGSMIAPRSRRTSLR